MTFALLFGLAGCGNPAPGGGRDLAGGGGDSAGPDDLAVTQDIARVENDLSTAPDLTAAPDLAPQPDLAMNGGGTCMSDNDCRLFSSYCVNAPCQCFALPAMQADPPCKGG